MTLTNKQMDEAEQWVNARRDFDIQNRNNNSSDYVSGLYNERYSHAAGAVPVRQGAGIDGPLFSVPGKPCTCGPEGRGIVTALRDLDGKLGKYLIEINGNNGVEVTRKL